MTTVIEKPHLVAVPFPAPGHCIPFLDFAKLLASHALTVTFVTTPANASRLQHPIEEAVSFGLDIRLLILPTPAVEGLPEGHESTDVLPAHSVGLIFQLAQKLAQPFNAWIDAHTAAQPPVCIIYDLIMGWAFETAERRKIGSFLFNSCGASATAMLNSVVCSISQNALQKEGDGVVLSWNLPRQVRLQRHEISADIMDPDLTNPRRIFSILRLQSIGESCGMLINTYEEMEGEYVEILRKLTGKPVWCIGPTNLSSKLSGVRGKMADISEAEVVSWLDSRKARSVVYVSFGSLVSLTEAQTNALARGLEESGQAFVWVIRVPPKIEPLTSSNPDVADLASTYLPPGFRERTKDRGLVIWGWSPQLVVLSHKSVGAFISHCGWNSTMEGVTMGVPLIAWPMFGDQHFNSRLVKELGVGIQFCQHRDGIPDEKRVKEVLKLVLEEEEGKQMREGAERLKEMARKSVGEGGSSAVNLQAFVNKMHELNNTSEDKNSTLDTK